MTFGLHSGQFTSSPSKTVNIFDLTSKNKGTTSEHSEISSAKEKAARITLCVILTIVILTAFCLLLGEAFGLQWTLCSKPHNRTTQESWLRWPWVWKVSLPMSQQTFQERWNSMSLPQKRKALFQATLGEVDLYDMYDMSKDTHSDD